jgi:hypothetical protein
MSVAILVLAHAHCLYPASPARRRSGSYAVQPPAAPDRRLADRVSRPRLARFCLPAAAGCADPADALARRLVCSSAGWANWWTSSRWATLKVRNIGKAYKRYPEQVGALGRMDDRPGAARKALGAPRYQLRGGSRRGSRYHRCQRRWERARCSRSSPAPPSPLPAALTWAGVSPPCWSWAPAFIPISPAGRTFTWAARLMRLVHRADRASSCPKSRTFAEIGDYLDQPLTNLFQRNADAAGFQPSPLPCGRIS